MHNQTGRERGANLVEFAILAPFLIMLALGIIDFGWILGQQQDVRHGTREAARVAATNTGTVAEMTGLVCSAMQLNEPAEVTFTGGDGEIGDTGTVTVEAGVGSLTGFSRLPFAGALYPDRFVESITFRLEQDASSWDNGAGSC